MERRSNVVNSKWVFSWERGVVGVTLELVPTSVELLGSNIPQGIIEQPRDNTPRAIVFLPGKWFTKWGPGGDARCVLIKIIYSLGFKAAWGLGL